MHRWPPDSINTLPPGGPPYFSAARSAYRRLCTDGIQTREIYFHDVGPRIFRSEKRLQKTLRRWPPDSRNTLPPGRPPFFSAATALPAIAFVPSLQRQRFQQLQSSVTAATTLPGIAIVPPLQRQRFQELQSCRRCSDSASSNCSRAAAAATAPPEWYECSRNTQFSRKIPGQTFARSSGSHKCNSRAVPGEP